MLIISLLAVSLIRFSAASELHFLIEPAHQFCLDQLPRNSLYLKELSALSCAENFTILSQSKLYAASGLIHLFVVSGAHLILLEQILTYLCLKNKKSRPFVFILLLLYSFMCNLNAPICRAFISFSLQQFLYSKNIIWPGPFKSLVIGLMVLILNPSWLSSLSLQMSWMAAFATIIGQDYFKNESIFLRQSLFFVLLTPTFVFLQVPSFSSILFNLFLAPVLEFILFPLALLTFLINPLFKMFDTLIYCLNILLQSLEVNFNLQLHQPPPHWICVNWALILFFHLLTHFLITKKKQSL